MAQFASDTFAGTEGTELSAYNSAWTKVTGVSGSAEIASGRLRASSTTSPAYYHSGSPASADYTVSADAYYPPGGGTGAAWVVGRVSTSANTLYGYRTLYASPQVTQLFKIVAGTVTQLGSNSSKTVSAGNSYQIKLEMAGTAIKGYWNGSTSADISVTDSSITAAGKAGVRFFNPDTPTDTANWQLDNFSADDPASGGSYTLTASGGSFTHTGTAAGLLLGRKIAADAGTFALSGAAASFLRGRSLVAEGGTYALTGADVGLRAGRKLSAEGGEFTLTGADATFGTSNSLIADAGEFTLTGGEITFGRTYVLAAEPGTFTLSGGDASLQTEADKAAATPAKGGSAYRNGFVAARKRIALQRMLDYLTEDEPQEETKQIIRAVKAGKPLPPEKKAPAVMKEISAEKIAASLIPARVAEVQTAIDAGLDVQRVILRAIEIARERDDEDVLLLL